METLTGSVERITYYNPENGYSVVRLRPDQALANITQQKDLITITGNLPELTPGEHLRLTGKWTNHPKHGLQFQSETCGWRILIFPTESAGQPGYFMIFLTVLFV